MFRLVALVVLLVVVGACMSSVAMAASLRSYHYSRTLYSVGCESAAQCLVTGHSTRPAGTRVLVVRNGRVLRAVTPKGTDYGNNSAVSCPSRRGCVAALPVAGGWGVVVVTLDGAGHLTTRRVAAPRGVLFNSISCATLTSCELAGISYDNGGIAMATWNGKRRGRLLYTFPPSPGHMYGQGNELPTVSCSASQCEVVLNYAVDKILHDAYQAFLVHLRHGTIDRSQWSSGLAVSSVSCGINRFCWAIVTATDGSFGARLAQINNGVLGTPRPLNVPASALACWRFTCAVVGNDQITTFISTRQTAIRTVPTAKQLFAPSAGPHGLFATVGTAQPSGSVLAISH